jgi:hypothetical protein
MSTLISRGRGPGGGLMVKVKGLKYRIFPRFKFSRSQYKNYWDSVSTDERHAKIAVGGHVDEQSYTSTAISTMHMLKQFVGINAEGSAERI